MIKVERIYEGIRQEGLGAGLPMAFVQLGEGREYEKVEYLVKEVMFTAQCKWICFLGEEGLPIGMGSLSRALHTIGLYQELVCPGTEKNPSWLHAIDRWVVDYVPDGLFDYFSLRNHDTIRFRGNTKEDLEIASEAFEYLKLFPGWKYFTVSRGRRDELHYERMDLSKKYDRVRIYEVG